MKPLNYCIILFLIICGQTSFCSEIQNEVKLDSESKRVFDSASAFYAGARNFEVRGSSSVVEKSARWGQQFDAVFSLTMARPSSLLFWESQTQPTGSPVRCKTMEQMLFSNQKTCAAYCIDNNTYTTLPPSANLRDFFNRSLNDGFSIIIFIVDQYVVFNSLFQDNPFFDLISNATGVYVGIERIGNIETEHVRLSEVTKTNIKAFDFWFAKGNQPFLIKWNASILSVFLPGVLKTPLPSDWSAPKIEETIYFSGWKMNNAIDPDRFEFHVPNGVELIPPSSWDDDNAKKIRENSAKTFSIMTDDQIKAYAEEMQRFREGFDLKKLWKEQK